MSDNEGEELTEMTEEILKETKKKPATVTVEHRFIKEGEEPEDPEQLKKKLEERTAQLELLALSAMEKEVEKLMEKVPEDKKTAVEELLAKNPQMIDVLKIQFGAIEPEDDGTEPVPPKGVVKAPKKPSKDTVEELYSVLTSNQSTAEQKRDADKKLDELWKKAMQDRKLAQKALRGED